MEIVIIEDRTKLQEIIWGLPCKHFMYRPNAILIEHPIKNEFIILKSRYSNDETYNLNLESFEYYNDRLRIGWDDEFDDLDRKNIIIDSHMLNDSGKAALLKL